MVITLSNCFCAADFLLPKDCSYEKWAVIACDQHTSEPEYWKQVREYIGDTPSTLNMFFPESDLCSVSGDLFEQYSRNMRTYLSNDFFNPYPNSYIYVERTLANGVIRQGIVGTVDLEAYDYCPGSESPVRATEKTVLERIPPRQRVRKDAAVELPHVLLLCDDD